MVAYSSAVGAASGIQLNVSLAVEKDMTPSSKQKPLFFCPCKNGDGPSQNETNIDV